MAHDFGLSRRDKLNHVGYVDLDLHMWPGQGHGIGLTASYASEEDDLDVIGILI